MLNTCWILLNQRKTTNAKYENDFHCGPWMSDKCDRILFNLNCHAIFLHMCQDTTRETECEHILTIKLYFYRFLCGKPNKSHEKGNIQNFPTRNLSRFMLAGKFEISVFIESNEKAITKLKSWIAWIYQNWNSVIYPLHLPLYSPPPP